MAILQELSPDSLLFDLDGTLWDASETTAKAWNETLALFGKTDFKVDGQLVRSFSGQRVEIILKENFPFVTEDALDSFFELYKKQEKIFLETEGGQLFPQVKEVLEELSQKYSLYIVSNCLSGYIENFLNFHQLNHLFQDFECSGNTGQPKTYNIQQVIERNQLQNPIYIGDTHWDAEAADNNTIPFVYASYGFGIVDNPKFIVQSFDQLLQ